VPEKSEYSEYPTIVSSQPFPLLHGIKKNPEIKGRFAAKFVSKYESASTASLHFTI
jgi:hypothetical protein